MLSCIATISVNGPLRTKLRAIADAGFEHVEIFESDLLAVPGAGGGGRRDDARPGARPASAFQPFRDFEGMPRESARARVRSRGAQVRRACRSWARISMLVSSNVSPECARATAAASSMTSASSASARRRAACASASRRSRGDGTYSDHRAGLGDRARSRSSRRRPGARFVQLAGAQHAHRQPAGRSIPAKLFHVQLADAPSLSMDPLSWSRHFRCMPGQGDLPLVEYVGGAAAASATRACCRSRSSTTDFCAGSATEVAVDGMRSTRISAGAGRAAHAGADARTRCVPAEWSSSSSARTRKRQRSSVTCCSTLGFAPTDRHRRKAVTRWRQGDINSIVNCEPEGFAHSYDTVHGASVCAIGVRVADPRRGAERARRLQISSFSQPVGPGEFEIPAVRGVGGSLIYFMAESGRGRRSGEPSSRHCRTIARSPMPACVRVDHFAQSHAVRRDAVVAAVLRHAVPGGQEPAGRDRGPGRARAEPGRPLAAIGDFESC